MNLSFENKLRLKQSKTIGLKMHSTSKHFRLKLSGLQSNRKDSSPSLTETVFQNLYAAVAAYSCFVVIIESSIILENFQPQNSYDCGNDLKITSLNPQASFQ